MLLFIVFYVWEKKNMSNHWTTEHIYFYKSPDSNEGLGNKKRKKGGKLTHRKRTKGRPHSAQSQTSTGSTAAAAAALQYEVIDWSCIHVWQLILGDSPGGGVMSLEGGFPPALHSFHAEMQRAPRRRGGMKYLPSPENRDGAVRLNVNRCSCIIKIQCLFFKFSEMSYVLVENQGY